MTRLDLIRNRPHDADVNALLQVVELAAAFHATHRHIFGAICPGCLALEPLLQENGNG